MFNNPVLALFVISINSIKHKPNEQLISPTEYISCTLQRSGSSIMGKLLGLGPHAIYLYEPLRVIGKAGLAPAAKKVDLLDQIFKCNVVSLKLNISVVTVFKLSWSFQPLLNCCHTDKKKRMKYSQSSCSDAEALVAKTIRVDAKAAAEILRLYPLTKVDTEHCR